MIFVGSCLTGVDKCTLYINKSIYIVTVFKLHYMESFTVFQCPNVVCILFIMKRQLKYFTIVQFLYLE